MNKNMLQNEEYYIDQFIPFLKNELSISEKAAFKKALKTYPSLQAELNAAKKMQLAIDHQADLEALRPIQAIMAANGNPYLAQKKPAYGKIALAIAAVLLVLAGLFYYKNNYTNTPNLLLEPYPLQALFEAPTGTTMGDAMTLYANENYSNAATQFAKQWANQQDSTAYFFYGTALYYQGKYSEASTVFQAFSSDTYLLVSSDLRQFYQAINTIALGDETGYKVLEKLQHSSDEFIRNNAANLLEMKELAI